MSDKAVYDMSDEEFANLPENYGEGEEESSDSSEVLDEDLSEEDAREEESEDSSITENTNDEPADEEDESDTTDSESEEEPDDSDLDLEDDSDASSDATEDESTKDTEEGTDTEEAEPEKDTGSDDSADALAKLYAPFKANGKDMQIDNVDDAITLMQKGAGFDKAMAGTRQARRTQTMLDNHGIKEEDLSFLIDLHKGDKGAISKLISTSGIDPLEIDPKKDPDYRPNSYRVEDNEVALNEALASIADTPHYSRTVDVVSKQWDDESKKAVYENPEIMRDINTHMANGLFETVTGRVNKERVLGRLGGLSDVAAYAHTFKQIQTEQANTEKQLATNQATLEAKRAAKESAKMESKAKQAKLDKQKKIAGGGKPQAKSTDDSDNVDLYALSDEEFQRRFGKDL